MDKYFYIDSSNRQQGPVDEAEFKRLGLSPNTKIWRKGMKKWVNAGEIISFEASEYDKKSSCSYFRTTCSSTKNSTSRERTSNTDSISVDTQLKTKNRNNGNSSNFYESGDKLHTLCIINAVILGVLLVPVIVIFQLAICDYCDYSGFGDNIKGRLSLFYYVAEFWPLIAIVAAIICCVLSFTETLREDRTKCLMLSGGISVGSLLLCLIFKNNPGAGMAVAFILAIIAFFIMRFISDK